MISDLNNIDQIRNQLADCNVSQAFYFGDLEIIVHSNSPALLSHLKAYYLSYFKLPPAPTQTLNVSLIDQPAIGASELWVDVPREGGKQGKKEGYLDASDGRWIYKFKTGMCFHQNQFHPIAIGPCLDNVPQVVNFINNQFLNNHLQQDYVLGHAAAFSQDNQVTAIAASSGGGKSTLMLRCLEHPDRDFITNDRILMKQVLDQAQAIGLAKMPRVNPGTLINSPRLKHILPSKRQAELRQLSSATLWHLEEKYDVQIEQEYGPKRIQIQGLLTNLIMLDWSNSSTTETALEKIDLTEDPVAIDGLRKRPGPFFINKQGKFANDLTQIGSYERYQRVLKGVNIYRLTGKVDFDKAYELLEQL